MEHHPLGRDSCGSRHGRNPTEIPHLSQYMRLSPLFPEKASPRSWYREAKHDTSWSTPELLVTSTEYTPRRPRSSDQALRGDFFRKPQPARAEIARNPSRIVPTLRREGLRSARVPCRRRPCWRCGEELQRTNRMRCAFPPRAASISACMRQAKPNQWEKPNRLPRTASASTCGV